MSIDNNIPAFPNSYADNSFAIKEGYCRDMVHSEPQSGLTMLDHFAGLAMQGMYANSCDMVSGFQPTHNYGIVDKAELAYKQAAAMLQARKAYIP